MCPGPGRQMGPEGGPGPRTVGLPREQRMWVGGPAAAHQREGRVPRLDRMIIMR
jgi:hypothetical protein